MEGIVVAEYLEEFELDYVLSLMGINPKGLPLNAKRSLAQDILERDWLLLITTEKKQKVGKEFDDIHNSLASIRSSIESFTGLKNDPVFNGVSGRIILLSQRVKNFTVRQEPENVMLRHSQFKYHSLAQCFELKAELNKKSRNDDLQLDNIVSKSISLKEKKQGFTSICGRYFHCNCLLGEGAFGQVFEVKHKLDKRLYALKKIRLPIFRKSRHKVFREVETLAKLEHKNIVRYYHSWVRTHRVVSLAEQLLMKVVETDDENQINETLSTATSPSTSRSISDHHKVEDQDSYIVFADAPPSNHKNAIAIQESTNKKGDKFRVNKNRQIIRKKAVKRRHSGSSFKKYSLSKRRPPTTFLYIQMELCKGGNLKEWLYKNQDRNYYRMVRIYLQILDAVIYLHSVKLVHRDLKPGNIFFSENGDIIKVGDLGLALDIGRRNITRGGATASGRHHTKGVGTELYMSPELTTSGIYDYKVDVYALGIIFFELLVPFSTDMERNKIVSKLRESNEFPSGFNDTYPVAYRLITNMLERNPKKRYAASKIRDNLMFSIKMGYIGNNMLQ